MERYDMLNVAAQTYLREHKLREMEQILATLQADGKIEVYHNDLSEAAEADFLSRQTKPLRALLCLWQDATPDLPSHRVRSALLGGFSENASCEVFLRGEDGICMRKLAETL